MNISELTDLDWEIIFGLADNDLKVATTAKKLFMCRGSIEYHIHKIFRKTGLDPRKFHDMVKLLEIERTGKYA